jgi:hypothetical protein
VDQAWRGDSIQRIQGKDITAIFINDIAETFPNHHVHDGIGDKICDRWLTGILLMKHGKGMRE